MTLEYIAVQGMTVIVDQSTVTPLGAGTVVATIAILPPTKSKVRATSLVHVDGDQITVTAITVPSAGATTPDPGPYTVALNATALKVRAENELVLREGDQSVTISAVPQIPGSPPTNYPVSFKCKISSPGQTKVKAQ